MDNKLIAEFMGVEEAYNPNGNDFVFKTTISDTNGDTDILKSCKVNSLSYHTSWDWLMPVIEEIDHLNYEPIDTIEKSLSTRLIKNTHKAVVQFIKEYNQNK